MPREAFADLAFAGAWRDYQARVLRELDTHWEDDRLHIVAPPGSGKTMLGLEIMRRSAAPTWIVAPTIPIQHQWVRRLALFRDGETEPPAWVSLDPRAPALMTVVTYQSLVAARPVPSAATEATAAGAARRRRRTGGGRRRRASQAAPVHAPIEREPDLVARLVRAGVRTLILDEAHHLRREWWRVLTAIQEAMPELRTVSLTATPPYDVDPLEWTRYVSLCGPIDCEIFVPELVRAGDLCPHQDYVHFSLPRGAEAEAIESHEGALEDVIFDLLAGDSLAAWLAKHPFVVDPVGSRGAIYGAPGYYVACLVVARHAGVTLSPAHEHAMLGVPLETLPALDAGWLERFLDGALRAARDGDHEAAWAERAERALRRMGVLEGRRLRLLAPPEVARSLCSSAAKIESILAIVAAEHALLGDALRMVILTDYIRREALPCAGELDASPLSSAEAWTLGAVPIFEAIRRSPLAHVRPAVLTGSLVLMPAAASPKLARAAAEAGVPKSHVTLAPCDFDEDYVEVSFAGELAARMVACVTEVFSHGGIRALIGTAAFLGEGWDAPAANTLVLASNVSSYMLGNQMRGRVIRSDPERPDKAAHIWHLATLTPRSLARRVVRRLRARAPESPFVELGEDLTRVEQRFEMFDGVSLSDPVRVMRGMARLGLPAHAFAELDERGAQVAALNEHTLRAAGYRGELAALWSAALDGPTEGPVRVREWVRAAPARRSVAVPRALRHGVGALALMSAAAYLAMRVPMAGAAVAIGAALYARTSLAAVRAGYRSRTLATHLREVTRILIEALHAAGALHAGPSAIDVVALPDTGGAARCRVERAPQCDAKRVLEALAKLVDPPDDPRYLLVERSLRTARGVACAFAVPALLGRRREDAARLAALWSARIAPVELLSVRTPEGRSTLMRAFAAGLSLPQGARARKEWEWRVGSVDLVRQDDAR